MRIPGLTSVSWELLTPFVKVTTIRNESVQLLPNAFGMGLHLSRDLGECHDRTGAPNQWLGGLVPQPEHECFVRMIVYPILATDFGFDHSGTRLLQIDRFEFDQSLFVQFDFAMHLRDKLLSDLISQFVTHLGR